MLRWSATAAARLSSTATQLEPVEQEIKPSFADVDTYETCELSEGNYTMSNLSEIRCASETLKLVNSSNKLVLAAGVAVRFVGKGKWGQTKLEFDISLLPGAGLYLEALHFQGRIEVEETTSIGQSNMSYLTFVNCSVAPPARDAKQQALAELEQKGLQDPSASAWWGWLMLRDAALTLQIHDSYLEGGAFVEQSTNFNLSASKSHFDLFGQGFQLFNVTSHIRLGKVEVWSQGRHPSFQMLSGRHEVHVAGSTFVGSAIQIEEPLYLILNVSTTRFRDGQRAIVVIGRGRIEDIFVNEGFEGHSSQVDLQDVTIYNFVEYGVGASDFHSAMGSWRAFFLVFFCCLSQCRPNGCGHSG